MKKVLAISLFVVFSLPVSAWSLFLGPYSGTVVDSTTGQPIEGATILINWQEAIPHLLGREREHIGTVLLSTDSKGAYRIPARFYVLSIRGFLESTDVVIYQPGYQAYIRRIWHDNPYARPDDSFKKRDNVVRLERIPPGFSHANHYSEIESALWGIDTVASPVSGSVPSWDAFVDRNVKSGVLEKDELLRRAEWEYRRGMREDRR